MPKDSLDEFDWLELHGYLSAMRNYLVETIMLCLFTLALCKMMLALVPLFAVQIIFTLLLGASALLAIVQTAVCSAEIIRLTALLQTWDKEASDAASSFE
jgi:hypothetical protein